MAETVETTATVAVFEAPTNLELVLDIPVEVTVELGRARLTIRDLLALGPGAVVELSKLATDKVDIFVNQKPIAHGETVTVNDRLGVRLVKVIDPSERIAGLG
jgi:flagellar motor switch protein FliN/FliY